MPALQVAVDVVLEDHELVARRELEHARRIRGADARAGRVVRHRVQDEELGLLARQQALERRDVGAVRGARHADDARAESGEAREHHEPRRVLDEHRVARREEAPRHQVDGLGGAGGGQDLLGGRLDADVREARRQRFAQR